MAAFKEHVPLLLEGRADSAQSERKNRRRRGMGQFGLITSIDDLPGKKCYRRHHAAMK